MTLKTPVGGGTRKMQVKLQHTPGSKSETWCLDNWGNPGGSLLLSPVPSPCLSLSCPIHFLSPLNTFSPVKLHSTLLFLFAFLASSHLMPNVPILATPLSPFQKPPNSGPNGLPLLSQLKIQVVFKKKKKKLRGKKTRKTRGGKNRKLSLPICSLHRHHLWYTLLYLDWSLYLTFLLRFKC